MKKQHFKILALSFLILAKVKAQSPGDIVITEFMPDPAKVSDASGEWFEVYNASNHRIDMSGWHITDSKTKSHTITTTNPLSIQAGDFLLFAIKPDSTVNGGIKPDYSYSSFTFANTSGKIVITNSTGIMIDSVGYSSTSSGKSWNLAQQHFKSDDNDVAENWCISSVSYGMGDSGTPGKMNTSCSLTEIPVVALKPVITLHAMNGELTVLFPEMIEKQKWEIIDITGRVVQTGFTPDSTASQLILLNKNGRGMYFFRLQKSGSTLKFIVE